MDLKRYQDLLHNLPFGKRLPNAVYVYRTDDDAPGPELRALLARIVAAFGIGPEFNVVKFRTDELKVSLLSYPEFLEDAHPSLAKAVTVDLASGKRREIDYSKNPNPPILHRKELFLPDEHPKCSPFAQLSAAEETAGLYEETATIGFKLNWERLLKSKGLKIVGHDLLNADDPDPPGGALPFSRLTVDRHKTAMVRYDLSKPVKTLLEYGLLSQGADFFDYGCGQGADIAGLTALGYTAAGWDPVFRPDAERKRADIVNLGFVLNVIEDPVERLETLWDAYRLARRLFVVSALITETVDCAGATRFRDGVITRRNTFQKYFDQQELQQFIEDALDATAVPVALGVFYVFRDPQEQQDFLSSRGRRTIDWTQISARLGFGGPRTRWQSLYRENKELLDPFGKTALGLGRFPTAEEFPSLDELSHRFGSTRRALRAFVEGGELTEGDQLL